MEKLHRRCLNRVEPITYTYWDECNKCKNGMWSCGRDCETKKTGIKYRCKFCSDENIYWQQTVTKEEIELEKEEEQKREEERRRKEREEQSLRDYYMEHGKWP